MRSPALAGVFYEKDPSLLLEQVQSCLAGEAGPAVEAIGVVVPHAGYVYSGRIAGRLWARTIVPERVVILAPNHTGLGRPIALSLEDAWVTPLGRVPVDLDFGRAVLSECRDAVADELAHVEEHAVEVHLPFLQVRNPSARIVPLCLRPMSLQACEALAMALARVVSKTPEPTLLVASSDLNHHEPLAVAARKDRMVLDRIAGLDPAGLYQTVVAHHVTMCGFVPAVVMLFASRALGARIAEVVAYGTSADLDGDASSVVGYAGVRIGRERSAPVNGCLGGTVERGHQTR